MTDAPLKLFNSLTRQPEDFTPVHHGEARVYTCGPTVYNYQHIGNMRAYIFADTLGRTLTWKGYKLSHVINITDVGHLTSDADAGDDKMEKAAAAQGKSAWDIARDYQEVFEADLGRLNVRAPAHPRATDYVESMIEWGKQMQDKHCYELDSGLYFDVSTVPEYGRLAGPNAQERLEEDQSAHMRIDPVKDKRNPADFAIWRKTPEGEDRQMEWDSPWGKGAPGWHLECSVMSSELLGHPFDIHTGGIDHREIHHPNEIAQNQAHNCSEGSAANIWMHNNFLIDRRGKMSKSTGDFLVLQTLVDRGFHPLAYRMLCLQAHYRSELEFTWEGLEAALTRLKRMVMLIERIADAPSGSAIDHPKFAPALEKFGVAMSDDLNTAVALTALEDTLATKKVDAGIKRAVAEHMDSVLGFGLFDLARTNLRIRPADAAIAEDEIGAALTNRKEARAAKDFAASDAIRDDLMAKGVEVMDGDPLGWEWKLN
ncbi:MAG: cysteine--tRNA ligase [Marinomonas sp.]